MKKSTILKTLASLAVSMTTPGYVHASCTANSTSISGACTDFVVNADIAATPPGTVAIGAAVTGTASSYAMRVEGLGNITNLNINSGGSVINSTGSSNTALVNGGVISNLNVASGTSISTGGGATGVGINNAYGPQLGTIGTITNAGTIAGGTGSGGVAIRSAASGSSISTINNTGTISAYTAISNSGTIGAITNSNTITGVIGNTGTITTLTNTSAGTINSTTSATINLSDQNSVITTLSNAGTISSTGGNAIQVSAYGALVNIPSIGSLDNTGTISSTNGAGILIGSVISGNTFSGKITSVTNSGLIEGSTTGISLQGSGEIGTLTNTATTYAAGVSGIKGITLADTATITTLNNAQNNLSYNGNLPWNYRVIVNSPTSFGKLNVTGAGYSTTTFGIYSSSTLQIGTYAGVLSGLGSSNITGPTTGIFKGIGWRLAAASSANVWDLVVDSSAANTVKSIQLNTNGLATVMNQQAAAMQAALTYDCTMYDENNLCVSVGGRYTYAGPAPSENAQAGLVVVGYRPAQTIRVGAFADQSVNISTPSGFSQSKNGPMWGLFANWNMNKDGNGLGVQASAVTAASTLTATRTQMDFTEAGSGKTQMTGQGYRLTTNYHQPITETTKLVPYAGLQYTRVNNGSYTENAGPYVSAPLSYNAMAQNVFSAVAGLGVRSWLAERLTGTASVGIQQNLKYSMANYQGTSNITGLESFNVQMPGNVNSMATATAGLYYDVRKNERVGFNVLWQQQPFIATNTATALATYTIGF